MSSAIFTNLGMFENQDALSTLVAFSALSALIYKSKDQRTFCKESFWIYENRKLTDSAPFDGHFSVSAVLSGDRHLRHSNALLH